MDCRLNKRTIKVKYVDFYGDFDPCEHWVYKVLEKRYHVVFSESPDYLFFHVLAAVILLMTASVFLYVMRQYIQTSICMTMR